MIKNYIAEDIAKGLKITIESQYPNLEYSERISHIIRALEEYFGNKELVIVHADDLESDTLTINPYSDQFRKHVEDALGVDNVACENERRDILTSF